MKVKSFVIVAATLIGAILIISGIIMVYYGITQTGEINIKSAIVSGKIESGSLGLFFSFLGVVLILGSLLTKRKEKTTFKYKNGNAEIDWSHWESGDPHVDLYLRVFPKEEIPTRFNKTPIVDWLSKDTVTEIVDTFLCNELRNRSISHLSSILTNKGIKNEKGILPILQVMDRVFTKNHIVAKISEKTEYDIFPNEIVVDMLYMLHYSVSDYFISKKRIFAGLDKYPSYSPPVHPELATWLVDIEKTWFGKLTELVNSLNDIPFVQESHSMYTEVSLTFDKDGKPKMVDV